MKKFLLLIALVGMSASCVGCSENEQVYTEDDVWEIKQEIYEEAYEEGMVDAVETISHETSGWEEYIRIEELEDFLLDYYGEEGEEIRDSIESYVETYSSEDIFNEWIENCVLEY